MKDIVFLVLTQIVITSSAAIKTDVVNIPNGPIHGSQESVSNLATSPYLEGRDLTYRRFLGIPFADPPVGTLRFKPPQQLSATWNETREATTYPAICVQHQWPQLPQFETSEDCLYLSIWAPGDGSSTEPKAVMVWIYGGGYYGGSINLYDPTMLTIIGDVIVVNVAYRVNIFGFLSTGDDLVPGNMGLLDQQLGIRWVKDNIALFGGDPERITIFGESAGASSVTQHVIAPSNKGLFQRAISQSGTIFTPFAFQEKDMVPFIRETGTAVGCDNPNIKDLIECLIGVEATKLLNVALTPYPAPDNFFKWVPVVDGKFIVRDPYDLIGKTRGPIPKMLGDIDLMLGTNSDEGFLFVSIFVPFERAYVHGKPIPWENMTYTIPVMKDAIEGIAATYSDATSKDIIFKTLIYAYFGIEDWTNLTKEKITEIGMHFITDTWFTVPAYQFVKMHAAQGKHSYIYNLNYRKAGSFLPTWVKGTDHDEDLDYIIPRIDTFLAKPEAEQLLSYNMITYWTNFAKTGNPNDPVASPALPVKWPIFTADKEQYLELSDNITPIDTFIRSDSVKFYTEYLPVITGASKCAVRKFNRKENKRKMTIK
ncbi:unnamed protein product [Owenia fusiformis]|uniref:Carboxylic ester hydrolase n=1 Tax=Owenia fusiformis TaxID=6347 RepID=A0A8S4NZC4_OWEFU|nr:unnamed protein product [Owenia fusiformis]